MSQNVIHMALAGRICLPFLRKRHVLPAYTPQTTAVQQVQQQNFVDRSNDFPFDQAAFDQVVFGYLSDDAV